MAHVNTYLNFVRNTEEAFNFYKSVFGGEFESPGISRFGEIPQTDGMLPLPDEDKNLVMHVSLKILGEHTIMGTDAPESMGFKLIAAIMCLSASSPTPRKKQNDLFKALSDGGKVSMELQDTFWGAYYRKLFR